MVIPEKKKEEQKRKEGVRENDRLVEQENHED